MSRDSWYRRFVLVLLAPLILLSGFQWNPCLCGQPVRGQSKPAHSCCAQAGQRTEPTHPPSSHGPGCQMDNQAGGCKCAHLSASTTVLALTAHTADLQGSLDHALAAPATVTPQPATPCLRVAANWRLSAGRTSGSPPTFILNCALRC